MPRETHQELLERIDLEIAGYAARNLEVLHRLHQEKKGLDPAGWALAGDQVDDSGMSRNEHATQAHWIRQLTVSTVRLRAERSETGASSLTCRARLEAVVLWLALLGLTNTAWHESLRSMLARIEQGTDPAELAGVIESERKSLLDLCRQLMHENEEAI